MRCDVSRVSLLMPILMWACSNQAMAEAWESRAIVQSSYGLYSGSTTRESAVAAGLIMSADYLDTAGFSLGAGLMKLNMVSGYPIVQKSLFASGRYHVYTDSLAGKLTFRLDAHHLQLSNELAYREQVDVLAPQVSYLNYRNTFYADLGYAFSTYSDVLSVQQLTPTLGFALNTSADWLQTRGYVIRTSGADFGQDTTDSMALEVKWTHWFEAGGVLRNVYASGLVGERVYAVDGDAAAVYSLADVQRGGGAVGVNAKLFDALDALVLVGYDAYLNQETSDAYSASYIYLSLSKRW